MPAKQKVLTPVGKKIKKVRTAKKMSYEVLANETGFSVEYLKQIEAGRETPPVGALLQIARALELGNQPHPDMAEELRGPGAEEARPKRSDGLEDPERGQHEAEHVPHQGPVGHDRLGRVEAGLLEHGADLVTAVPVDGVHARGEPVQQVRLEALVALEAPDLAAVPVRSRPLPCAAR